MNCLSSAVPFYLVFLISIYCDYQCHLETFLCLISFYTTNIVVALNNYQTHIQQLCYDLGPIYKNKVIQHRELVIFFPPSQRLQSLSLSDNTAHVQTAHSWVLLAATD